jgi:hypothetical protein
MRHNMGNADRIVRVVLGVVIVAAGMIYQSWWGVIGLVPLLTAAVGLCPAYLPFGIRTCPEERAASQH